MLISNLSDANILTRKDRTEVNLPPANADPATLGDVYRAVVKGILGTSGMKVFAS